MLGPQRSQIRSEINVTPLIDVCLVLLIVFMVVTPILTSGPPVELPRTKDPRQRDPKARPFPILVVFDRPPQVLFGPDFRSLSPKDFRAAIAALRASKPDSEIVLRADRRLTYGDVKDVLRTLNEAGFHDVGLIAEKEAGDSSRR